MGATTAQKSKQIIMRNQHLHRRATDGIWKIAKTSPMFSVSKTGPSGREYKQYTRLINQNAYRVAMSGACAAVTGELQLDMKHLGMDYNADSKNRPFACTLAPGAAFMLEQFSAAVVQQIVYQNKIIRDGIKKHARNHKDVTKMAIDEVRKSIFGAASGVPSDTIVLPMSVARKSAPGDKNESKGEEEFVPGKAADNDEDDAADDEDEA